MRSVHEVAIPLVLGLAADDASAAEAERYITESLSAIVAELRAAYPHTPLIAISALASDAELIAAKAALALGVPIRACRAAVAGDGISPALSDALGACSNVDVVDASFQTHYGAFAAEAYVAHFSDLLIAFGAPPAPGSRLDAVVTLRERGRFAGAHTRGRILDPPDVGPYRRVLPQPGGSSTVLSEFPPRYYGDLHSGRDAQFALARLDELNRDLRGDDPADGALFSERVKRRAGVYTDGLQRRVVFWQRFLYWAAFVAATAEFVLPKNTVGTIVDFGAVGIAFALYFVARPRKYQGRYQDYRAISEALRVQTAWSKAGVAESVEGGYLRMQQTELQWIRNVLRTVALLQGSAAGGSAQDRTAVVDWVLGQRDYFRTAQRREAHRNELFHRWVEVLTPLNIVLGLGIFAFVAITRIDPIIPVLSTPDERYTLEVLVGTFAGWAALTAAVLHSYARTRGFSENANRYERMFLMFDEASLWLSGEAGRPLVEVRELAVELGREALAEHAEWLLTQRDRPLAIVHAGAA
ncbi:MAG TPA: hypothetical protein VFE70_01005 [Candidatus Elarobacter sp.]|nr:hypothetical protein [Candidatus Elarobacter sp.]